MNSDYKIFFCRREHLRLAMAPASVMVMPGTGTWNDFSHRSDVELRFTSRTGQTFQTHGKLGFLASGTNGLGRLEDITESSREPVLASSSHRFFSMLPSMQNYRTIVSNLGAAEARNALLGLHDLVAIKELAPRTEWLNSAVSSRIFLMSFVRNSEAYFAFRNAAHILYGLDREELTRVSNSLSIAFQLPGFENEHDLTFEFDQASELPKRVAVVIGKNGVGKSQALARIARAALSKSGGLRGTTGGERPSISRLLAFAPTTEVASVFPPERRKTQRIWYRRMHLNRARGRGPFVNDLIVQVARSEGRIKEADRWKIFLDAISSVTRVEELHLPSSDSEYPFLSLIKLKSVNERTLLARFGQIRMQGEPVRLIAGKPTPLSSGEISFVRFAAQVCLWVENGSLLLLDEPETHLHPNFISQFMAVLERMLELTGSIAIIATHSAYFVREVFQDQVTVLRITEDRFIHSERPRLRTFGGDVGAISFFVFGEEHASHLAQRVRSKLLGQNQSWEDLYEKYKGELSSEFLLSLRRQKENGDELS